MPFRQTHSWKTEPRGGKELLTKQVYGGGESNRAGADQLAAGPLQGAQAPFEDEAQAKNNPENDTAGSCFQGQPRPARRQPQAELTISHLRSGG